MAIEYPEAVIIAKQMKTLLPGRTVSNVIIRNPDAAVFKWGFSNLNTYDISGQKIGSIEQFGDYIFVGLDGSKLTFGDMIGSILYHGPSEKRLPKSAIIMELDDGGAFSYNPTLYGYCKAMAPEDEQLVRKDSWVQPLTDAFTPEYLAKVFTDPERKIAKQMNIYNSEHKVAGAGNGYWQEVLFLCGIHPQRKSKLITPNERERLHHTINQVMTDALNKGGSCDEKNFLGEKGGYVRAMGGHLKGQPCPRCGHTVTGKNILGANVYFCSECQK